MGIANRLPELIDSDERRQMVSSMASTAVQESGARETSSDNGRTAATSTPTAADARVPVGDHDNANAGALRSNLSAATTVLENRAEADRCDGRPKRFRPGASVSISSLMKTVLQTTYFVLATETLPPLSRAGETAENVRPRRRAEERVADGGGRAQRATHASGSASDTQESALNGNQRRCAEPDRNSSSRSQSGVADAPVNVDSAPTALDQSRVKRVKRERADDDDSPPVRPPSVLAMHDGPTVISIRLPPAPPQNRSVVGVAHSQPRGHNRNLMIRLQLPTLSPHSVADWRTRVQGMYRRPCHAAECGYERAYAVLAASLKDQGAAATSAPTVFRVVLSNVPTCTCDESASDTSLPCEHILFVAARVLGVPLTDVAIHQRGWTTSELYGFYMRRASHESIVDTLFAGRGGTRRPLDLDSECRICFKHCASLLHSVFCRSCGRNFHSSCVEIWRSWQEPSMTLLCPMCFATF